MTAMDTKTTTSKTPGSDTGTVQHIAAPCRPGSRGLMLATLAVAIAGFAGTAFSAAPAEMFGHPVTCIVSH